MVSFREHWRRLRDFASDMKIALRYGKQTLERIRESRDYFHGERDREMNNRSSPPESEEVRRNCIWLVETYPPSKVANLIEGIQRLRGKTSPLVEQEIERLIRWLSSTSENLSQGGSYRLGTFVRRDDSQGFTNKIETDIPDSASSVECWVTRPLPSLLVMTARFIPDETNALELDAILRRSYVTEFEMLGGQAYRIIQPQNHKRKAIEAARTRLVAEFGSWIGARFPGYFSSLPNERQFPSVEFTTLKDAEPFTQKNDGELRDYEHLLGLVGDWDAWESEEMHGLRLARDWSPNAPPGRIILAGRESDLFPGEDMESYGGRTPGGFINRVHSFAEWIPYWVLGQQLDCFESALARLRRLALVGKRLGKRLKTANDEYLGLSQDAIPFTSEMDLLAEENSSIVQRHAIFRAVRSTGEGQRSLLKAITEYTTNASARFRRQLTELHDTIQSHANLLSAQSTSRLTFWILVLTILLVVLNVLMVLQIIGRTTTSSERQGTPIVKVTYTNGSLSRSTTGSVAGGEPPVRWDTQEDEAVTVVALAAGVRAGLA